MPEQNFQPAEGAAIDTYISELNAAVNYGANANLRVTFDAAGNNRDILMNWDLSVIPTGSTIETATLYLWLEGEAGGAGGIPSYRISSILSGNSGWTEGACTWNLQDGANPWAGGAGCEVEGTDVALTYLWTGDPWQGGAPMWWQFDLVVSEFQYLIDKENYGFKIYSPNRAPGVVRSHVYTSAAGANPLHHPILYVRWIEPSGRLVEYTFNVWDPLQRIMGRDGHEVSPNEVLADKWGKLLGFRSP